MLGARGRWASGHGARRQAWQAVGRARSAGWHAWARGAGRGRGTAGARPGRWARGLARAVHSVHSAWFSTRFFDSVFFLNH